VDRSLRQAYLVASAAWLAVELSLEEFCAHIAAYAPGLGAAELELFAADLYLACACLQRRTPALEILERSIVPAACKAVARVSQEPQFVRACSEVLWQRLLDPGEPQLARYRGEDPLVAWISVVATGIALEHFRPGSSTDGAYALASQYLAHEVGNDLAGLHAESGPGLLTALEAALQQLSARDRNVLRLHLSGQCNLEQIGRAYGVHRATAARWLAETRATVKQQVFLSSAQHNAQVEGVTRNSGSSGSRDLNKPRQQRGPDHYSSNPGGS
jgi:RNA polymerase sigma-70 factor, ECF subfamily